VKGKEWRHEFFSPVTGMFLNWSYTASNDSMLLVTFFCCGRMRNLHIFHNLYCITLLILKNVNDFDYLETDTCFDVC
jgi:hypothetical protein